MNKRQAKKAYKKKYGYNPARLDPVCRMIADTITGIAKVVEIFVDAFSKFVAGFKENIGEAITKQYKFIDQHSENIRSMSNEEFDDFLKNSQFTDGEKQ